MMIKAPGKLMFSGEWSVLELGNLSIVTAVDKYVSCTISKFDKMRLVIREYGIDAKFSIEKNKVFGLEEKKLSFVRAAIEVVSEYLGKLDNFLIQTVNEGTDSVFDGKPYKLGFGSSAAVTVSVVAALFAFHGRNIALRKEKDIIFKLATIAHFKAQGKVGSGFDIAASTYGGLIIYKRFDPAFIEKKSLKELVTEPWPDLYIEEIDFPEDLKILVGWTKSSASTKEMINQMSLFKKEKADLYNEIINDINYTTRELISEIKKCNEEKIIKHVKENELLLRKLTKHSSVNIETKELRAMSEAADEAGGAGKLSGAGGGDCGIAICFDAKTAKKIEESWNKIGINIVNTKIDFNGVHADEHKQKKT